MTTGADFERFPRMKRELLENPARFLDREIPANPVSPKNPPKLESFFDDHHEKEKNRPVRDDKIAPKGSLARQRIASIDRVEVIRAWIAVERALANRDDRPVRDHVIELLEAREAELDEIGERPDRLEARDEPREIPEKNVVFLDENGEERDRDATASKKITRLRESDPEIATDGGES